MAEKNSIWDRFEYKGVVCYTGYLDRYALLKKELGRVGMTNVHPHWDFPNPFHQMLLRIVPMTKFNRNRSCFNIGMNNYRTIATAYYLGCKNCLVMEDDIRFLTDLELLKEILTGIPEDYDLALLDNNKPCSMSEEAYLSILKSPVKTHWYRFKNLRSTGCYAMSRKCMERYLKLFEAATERRGVLRNPDGYFREEYLGNDMNLYVSNPSAAIQKEFPTTHCSSARMAEYYAMREKTGIRKEKYENF